MSAVRESALAWPFALALAGAATALALASTVATAAPSSVEERKQQLTRRLEVVAAARGREAAGVPASAIGLAAAAAAAAHPVEGRRVVGGEPGPGGLEPQSDSGVGSGPPCTTVPRGLVARPRRETRRCPRREAQAKESRGCTRPSPKGR